MHTEKIVNYRVNAPAAFIFAAMIVGCVTAAVAASAPQTRSNSSISREEGLVLSRLHKAPPGKLLAEGENTNAVGPDSITAYRVEELQLPRSVKTKVGGREVESDKAWRITLTGGSFQVRAMPPALFIDGVLVGYGVENSDLTAITFVTLDRSLLREGATLAFAYGNTRVGRVELSEKLKLN